MEYIGEDKFEDSIKNVKISKSYISKIKEVAEGIIDCDPKLIEESYSAVDDETKKMFRDIRLGAPNKDIQIEDYVISVVANILRDEKKKKNYVAGKGKYLKASDKLIAEILKNDWEGNNISEFCRNNGIQRNKYYRILTRNLKHQSDVSRIDKIESKLKKNIENHGDKN